MKYSEILVTGAAGKAGHTVADQRFTTATEKTHEIPSAQAWFAGGERVGYDPKARAILGAQDAPAQRVPEAGGRFHPRRILPARISGWLIWMGQGSPALAERRRDTQAFRRVRWHG